jgi:ADP-heptose:LPS heptosyltransferase
VGFYRFHNEGLYRGEMLTHKVAYNPHIHISKNFIALVNSLLSGENELPFSKTVIPDSEVSLPVLRFSELEQDRIKGIIRKLYPHYDRRKHRIVLINPNASELLPQRRWMPEYFCELMKMILDFSEDVLLLITGAPSEAEEAESLRNSTGSERCVNFAGRVKFSELPTLYSISEFMITNDSGPGHFSSITPMPTYVFFGPETPALYGSLGKTTPIYAHLACSPCVSAANHRKTPCEDNKCLQVIKPEHVFEIIRKSLEF